MISEYMMTQLDDQEIKKPHSITGSLVKQKRLGKKVKRISGNKEKRRLSEEQVKSLEMHFEREHKLEMKRKVHLAAELGLDANQVAVWFQNRRARWKHKQMEKEYEKLKAMHKIILGEKCILENEVLNLKEKITEAEERMKKLTVYSNGAFTEFDGHCSTSYSCSIGEEQTLVGEFGDQRSKEYMNIECIDEQHMNEHCMTWWLDYV
ncbi:hypothetical protein J5N97_027446 [Dioscorea zingiberensis]|uniref:Homeobox-leucine zipper protein n=1 Tax=Dioscorea zingiberensis TaxID=325984 RepID=A0A9D5C4T1_9LILI|nr:hypothetical protein J5N97_027446 [Dioscorea zingiberensis]